ncbi:deoxyguanosinetriphosphate triphosphohydrolase [Coprococcus sp. AF21-14LB]|uniref:deoxyguanosinetriphosphate triphosphohydrolase n=1 Tax=Coprococcus sp. AF21-14LB TaxID=2292231 RepID=UPI000E5526B7|nr:deoxyguanosinetriphosphate triphosphohydrolase [Coprococcus sp. AF21-14LB]RGS80989.1 deoxyguanosinetriphosphate triphosphohydrolase [Coprococcus sp. AF21-14LB]
MEWKRLLSEKRCRETAGQRNHSDLRSEFEKDYHRIIGSASFRRLQDKTQVFPLDKSDFIRTRLTHSLEVSSLAKSLGQNIGEYILSQKCDETFTAQMKEDLCNIVQCAGLIHDIGNPPFGHFGEITIREWFEEHLPQMTFYGRPITEVLTEQMQQDFYHFEGNAQALRLVSKLHFLVDEYGMNLTYGLLNTIIKYPVSSLEVNPLSDHLKDKKIGYYYAEKELFEEITKETGAGKCRHPLTYILEAADDLAYKTADIEDAFVKGFVSYEILKQELGNMQMQTGFDALGTLERLYRRAEEKNLQDPAEYAVKNWLVRAQSYLIQCATEGFTQNYNKIMAGEKKTDLFEGTAGEELMELLGNLAYKKVFDTNTIYRMEVTESVMVHFLMDKFVGAIIYYDTDRKLNSIEKRLVSFISENYRNAYHCHAKGKSEEERLYLRLLLVTDYICGMTDSYAKRLYQEMNAMVS